MAKTDQTPSVENTPAAPTHRTRKGRKSHIIIESYDSSDDAVSKAEEVAWKLEASPQKFKDTGAAKKWIKEHGVEGRRYRIVDVKWSGGVAEKVTKTRTLS